jgi:hypothetical protein
MLRFSFPTAFNLPKPNRALFRVQPRFHLQYATAFGANPLPLKLASLADGQALALCPF